METDSIIVVAKDYEEEELENCCSGGKGKVTQHEKVL